jgi:hypothetical protein
MTKRTYNWPSREEWTHRLQHPYWDCETGYPWKDRFGHKLSDYATPEEVAVLTTALKDLYRELGSELRAANLRINPSHRQQRGEGQKVWYQRFKLLPAQDREAFHAAGELERERSQVNDLLAKIRDDAIPNQTRHTNWVFGRAKPLVTPFAERYEAANKAALEQWKQECLQRPVDDAAWEEELCRRKRIEDRDADDAAHPERFIHTV